MNKRRLFTKALLASLPVAADMLHEGIASFARETRRRADARIRNPNGHLG
jgi:hypothetical protein